MFREIEDHLGVLGQYATLTSNVGNTSNIKKWLTQSEEVLSAEFISKELPEVNQKIMMSLQKFMVRKARHLYETMFMRLFQVEAHICIAADVGIIRADQASVFIVSDRIRKLTPY
jgi:hypothetical protein